MQPTHDKCGMRKQDLRIWLGIAAVILVYALLVVPVVQGLTTPDSISLTPAEYAAIAENPDTTTGDSDGDTKYITVKLFNLFPIKKVQVNLLPFDHVLVGGLPIGFCGEIDGVLVTADGELRQGDVIHAVDGVAVNNLATYQAATAGKSRVQLTLTRNGKTIAKTLDPTLLTDLRDTTTGVGILTFINPDNQTFSALGHQMTDFDTGAALDLSGGSVRSVNTYGIVKTQGHQTGVIQSSITNTPSQGSITNGNAYGIRGCLRPDSPLLTQATTTLPVATRYHVKPGAATLRTSLDGETVEEFSCEILKTRWQTGRQEKSMVIRVTDPRLLNQTGGIVHGMSGSPIIQDNHLVGVLTHAITHDPAKGYALYIDFVNI